MGQVEIERVLCPRCQTNYYTPYGGNYTDDAPPPALSRTTRGPDDEKVYVCSPCGTDEGMQDAFQGGATPQSAWPITVEGLTGFGMGRDKPDTWELA